MRSEDAGIDDQAELFELTQSLAHIGVWTLDEETYAVTWTAELGRIVGRPVDELEITGADVKAMVHPDDRALGARKTVAALQGEPTEPWQLRFVRPDGDIRWVETRARLIRPGYLIGVAQDVTDRVAIQLELEASQARADIAQEIGHFAAIQMDLAKGTVTWSPEMWRITGRDPESFSPDDEAFLAIHPDDQAMVVANTQEMAAGGEEKPVEFRIIRPDGQLRWLKSHGRLIGDNQIVGFVHDITDIRAREEERQLHTRILELMNESVALVGETPPRYFYVNPRFAADVGLTPEEVLETSPEHFVDDPEVVDQLRDAILRDGHWDGDLHGRRSDGSARISHMSLTTMNLVDSGTVTLVVSADVTEQRHQEEELRQSEEQHRLILEHSPIGMGILGLDGRWVDLNPALCAILGRDIDELRTLRLEDVTHPDDFADDVELIAELLSGHRKSYQREKRYIRPDGRIVWVLVSVFLLRDADGEPQCFVGQIIDTSDRKEAEFAQRRYAERLQEANEAKTGFLSRMSHELRTPLNAVLGYSQLLALAELGNEDHESVEQIISAGRHLLGLIDEVLDITSVEAGSLRLVLGPVDVAAVIDDAVLLVQPMAASHGVTIANPFVSSEAEPVAFADRQRVTQILLNLLSNAIKYNRPGGTITVTITTVADRVEVAVSDTGRGIPADALSRVFDPFDRLGADQLGIEGTGIGLSLARNLAERMDGTLTVRSEPGEGSTFTLELPARSEGMVDPVDTGSTSVSAVEAAPRVRPLRVVHIEDNPTNQKLVEAALRRRANVELHTASTGSEGLVLVGSVLPDLVLLDLHLTDMAGGDVLRQVKTATALTPPVVVVISADANLEQINTVIALGADQYLTKPLDLNALYKVVDRLTVDGRA